MTMHDAAAGPAASPGSPAATDLPQARDEPPPGAFNTNRTALSQAVAWSIGAGGIINGRGSVNRLGLDLAEAITHPLIPYLQAFV